MANYISDKSITKLEPMNANFGIFRCEYNGPKNEKKQYYSKKALDNISEYAKHV